MGAFNNTVTAQLAVQYFQTGLQNPQVTATGGPKGTIYLRVGDSGGTVYVHQTDSVDTNWTELSSGGGGGSLDTVGEDSSPEPISAAGFAFTGDAELNVWFVESDGGAVTVTADPQIAVGELVGQRLTIIGKSDVNTIMLSDGAGLSLNGAIVLDGNNSIDLVWGGTVWNEVSRRQ